MSATGTGTSGSGTESVETGISGTRCSELPISEFPYVGSLGDMRAPIGGQRASLLAELVIDTSKGGVLSS